MSDITIQTYKYEYIFMLPSQTYSNSVFGEFHTNDCWFCIFVPKVFCSCFFYSSTAPKEAFYISALACVVQTYAIWLNDFTHSVKKVPDKDENYLPKYKCSWISYISNKGLYIYVHV